MNSVFEILAHEDAEGQVTRRKALAIAHKRVTEKFDRFLAQKTAADYTSRLELIKDDFDAVVKTACAEVGYADSDSMCRTLWNERLVHSGTPKQASTEKESRRPKTCPYHSEVIDASLAAGDPGAGYSAMSQHAWGDKHCQSDGWEGGRCSFKPEMTTQSFWDQRKEDAAKRREERAEQQQTQEFEQPVDHIDDEGNVELEDAGIQVEESPVIEPEVDNVVEVDFGGEAGESGLTSDELMSVAASAQRFVPLGIKTADDFGGAGPGQEATPGEAGGGNSAQCIPGPHGIHNGTANLLGFLDASINGEPVRSDPGKIVNTYSPFNRQGWEAIKHEPVTVTVPHPAYLPAAIEIIEGSLEASNSGEQIKQLAERMHNGEVPFPPGVSPEEVHDSRTAAGGPGQIVRPDPANPNAPVPAAGVANSFGQPQGLPAWNPNNPNAGNIADATKSLGEAGGGVGGLVNGIADATKNPAPVPNAAQVPDASAIHDQFSQMNTENNWSGTGGGHNAYNPAAHSQENYQQVADKMGIGVDQVRNGLDSFYDKSKTAPAAPIAPTPAMTPGLGQQADSMVGQAAGGALTPPAATPPNAINERTKVLPWLQSATAETGDSTEQRKDINEAHDLKLDKRTWTPQNLQQRLETEGENSPHKTVRQDVVHDLNDPSRPDDSGKLEQIGEHLTEHQDVTQDSGFRANNDRTWK